jgi:hypothetical protein
MDTMTQIGQRSINIKTDQHSYSPSYTSALPDTTASPNTQALPDTTALPKL